MVQLGSTLRLQHGSDRHSETTQIWLDIIFNTTQSQDKWRISKYWLLVTVKRQTLFQLTAENTWRFGKQKTDKRILIVLHRANNHYSDDSLTNQLSAMFWLEREVSPHNVASWTSLIPKKKNYKVFIHSFYTRKPKKSEESRVKLSHEVETHHRGPFPHCHLTEEATLTPGGVLLLHHYKIRKRFQSMSDSEPSYL